MKKSIGYKGIDPRIKTQIDNSHLASMSPEEQLKSYKESVEYMKQNGTPFTKSEFKEALKEIR